jgi:hypothetical protein
MIGGVSVQALRVQDTQAQDTIPTYITSNFLRLLGVRPARGREFTLDEERVGGSAVAMITYGLWQRVYGGRADVLERTIRVVDDDRPYTMVGVTPPRMRIPVSLYRPGSRLHEATRYL